MDRGKVSFGILCRFDAFYPVLRFPVVLNVMDGKGDDDVEVHVDDHFCWLELGDHCGHKSFR